MQREMKKPRANAGHKRRRGALSVPCPHCGAPTRVLRTLRTPEGVRRERLCRKAPRRCERFHSLERAET